MLLSVLTVSCNSICVCVSLKLKIRKLFVCFLISVDETISNRVLVHFRKTTSLEEPNYNQLALGICSENAILAYNWQRTSCQRLMRYKVREVIVILIVNSKLLKRHSKTKRRAPAYSRALRQIRGFSKEWSVGGSGPVARR